LLVRVVEVHADAHERDGFSALVLVPALPGREGAAPDARLLEGAFDEQRARARQTVAEKPEYGGSNPVAGGLIALPRGWLSRSSSTKMGSSPGLQSGEIAYVM